jgi:hypothetical protein
LRAVLIHPLLIALTAACGVVVVRGLSRDLHLHEMYLAAACVLVSAELSLAPLILARRFTEGSQADLSQAGLISTLVHLLASAGMGLALSFAMHLSQPFLYWLAAMYWMTLIGLCGVIIVAIRRAPVAKSPSA